MLLEVHGRPRSRKALKAWRPTPIPRSMGPDQCLVWETALLRAANRFVQRGGPQGRPSEVLSDSPV
eukprot:6869884-Alexandrium_andersonii.AAC.1